MSTLPNFKQPVQNFGSRVYQLMKAIRSYIAGLSKAKEWNECATIILKTLVMSWKHGLIILLLIIPVLMLGILPQGKDLLENMLNPENIGSGIARTIWFMIMVCLTSYAIWAIPRFYITHEENRVKKHKEDMAKILTPPCTTPATLQSLLELSPQFQSKSSHFLKILAATPFILYGIAFFLHLNICNFVPWQFIGVNMLLGLFFILVGIHWKYQEQDFNKLLLWALGLLIFIPVIYTLINNGYDCPARLEVSHAVLGNGFLMMTILVYLLLDRWEKLYAQDATRGLQRKGDKFYKGMIVLTITGMVFLIFLPNFLMVTTIPLLTFIFGTYILWLNWLSYKFKVWSGSKKFAFIAILGVLMVCQYNWPSRGHSIFLVDQPESSSRFELDTFTNAWFKDRKLDKDNLTEPKTIYLIAGQGGGSRAGLWTAQILKRIDQEHPDSTFSENVFAISTISGSSVGAAAWVKWLRLREDLNLPKRSYPHENFFRMMYSYNFVSGGLFDLFFTDFIRSLWPNQLRSGRNVRLIKEEQTAFLWALDSKTANFITPFNAMVDKQDSLCSSRYDRKIANYQFMPYHHLWMDTNGSLNTRIPLTFFNTTEMSTGRQVIVSPANLPPSFGLMTIDLLDSMKLSPGEGNKTIPFGVAYNLSQLFPVFSAFTHVDNFGHVMDGGGYDNSGTTTLLDVYRYLQNKIQADSLDSLVKITVLYIENGNELKKSDSCKKPQMMSVISQASSQPFTAIVPRAIASLQQALSENKDTLHIISLHEYAPVLYCPNKYCSNFFKKKCNETDCIKNKRMTFPNTRDLSKMSIDSIMMAAADSFQIPILK